MNMSIVFAKDAGSLSVKEQSGAESENLIRADKVENEQAKHHYWQEFYRSNEVNRLSEPSEFARFVASYLHDQCKKNELILELGCGNGRDTHFFKQAGYQVIGVDYSARHQEAYFVNGDAISNICPASYYYMRFFAHAIDEQYLDSLLTTITEYAPKGALVFIETRSTKGITDTDKAKVNFKSSIGEKHYRYLYSKAYFSQKIATHFSVLSLQEAQGLAAFGSEDPYIIRVIARAE